MQGIMQRIKLIAIIGLIFFSCNFCNSFDHEKNIQDNLRKLKSDPQNCLFLDQVASSYSALKQYKNAIKFYDETIENCPNNYHAIFQKGICYYLIGDMDKAFNYMSEAITKANELGDKEFAKIYEEEMNAWRDNVGNSVPATSFLF